MKAEGLEMSKWQFKTVDNQYKSKKEKMAPRGCVAFLKIYFSGRNDDVGALQEMSLVGFRSVWVLRCALSFALLFSNIRVLLRCVFTNLSYSLFSVPFSYWLKFLA